MKYLTRILLLSLLMALGGRALAQYGKQATERPNGYILIGAAMPMNDFGKIDDFASSALIGDGNTQGGANIGLNIGLKWKFGIGVEGLGVILGVDGFYNGPNEDMKGYYRAWEKESEQYYNRGFSINSTPQYLHASAMLGLNYIFYVNPSFGLYAEAGYGGNCRFITEWSTKGIVGDGEQIYKETNSRVFNNAFGTAYQFGAGIEVSQSLVIGCNFYSFAGKQVVAEETNREYVGGSLVSSSHDLIELGTISPTMIVVRVGFKL